MLLPFSCFFFVYSLLAFSPSILRWLGHSKWHQQSNLAQQVCSCRAKLSVLGHNSHTIHLSLYVAHFVLSAFWFSLIQNTKNTKIWHNPQFPLFNQQQVPFSLKICSWTFFKFFSQHFVILCCVFFTSKLFGSHWASPSSFLKYCGSLLTFWSKVAERVSQQ